MAQQTGFKAFLDKINSQIDAFQKGRKAAQRNQASLKNIAKANDAVDQNPGMLLEIGNELLITAEITHLYSSLAKSLGRVVLIDQISAKETRAIRADAFGIQVDVDTKVAKQMRAAYLQREQAWTAAANPPVPAADSVKV